MLSDNALARFTVLAMQGKSTKARGYLMTMLPKTTNPADVIAALKEDGFTDDAVAFMVRALPWLEEPALGVVNQGAYALDISKLLENAGPKGLPANSFEPGALAGLIDDEEIAEFDEPTGGRPRKMVRLRKFDPRYNIWA